MRYWIKVEDPFSDNPNIKDIIVPGVVQVEGTFRLYTDDEVVGIILTTGEVPATPEIPTTPEDGS